MRILAVLLIVAAGLWRVLTLHAAELGNFAPLMALAFCGGSYFKPGGIWLVPFLALGLSDLYIDHVYAAEYNYHLSPAMEASRLVCFAAAILIGCSISSRRSWLKLLNGIMGSSLLFYFVTNTVSWKGDMGYSPTAAGWWQAMTVGHPQFAPTLFFFRNTFVSDLLFTGAFVLVMEALARRRGAPSLLGAPASGN